MKKIYKDKILNIKETDKFDNKFLFEVYENKNMNFDENNLDIIFMSDLLEKRKNLELLEKVKNKPAMFSNVYSPKDEFEIFSELFENAIKNKKRIHIIWITLKEEIELLEKYYEKLWFFREETNTFQTDFSKPLITVSVKIENLIWKWSDYKKMWEKIFFNPPIRESGQVKAMFKWINRWVIAWIYIDELNGDIKDFLWDCITWENILAITLAKVLKYNYLEIWIIWEKKDLIISY